MLTELFQEMVEYYKGDPKRIQHFLKVHSFARMIGGIEGLDPETQEVLEAAAYVHDIGIKPAEAKFGSSGGKLQEQEGPPVAREMLENIGFSKELTDRVCWLVGHHHTYDDVQEQDYQILIEADFLVNLFEDSATKASVSAAYKNIFRTESGKQICRTMFDLDENGN